MSKSQKAHLKEVAALTKKGWTVAEAEQLLVEREWSALRADCARLDALDTTEGGDFKDSARENALLTCEEAGLPRDPMSKCYLESYAATLRCLFDDARIEWSTF